MALIQGILLLLTCSFHPNVLFYYLVYCESSNLLDSSYISLTSLITSNSIIQQSNHQGALYSPGRIPPHLHHLFLARLNTLFQHSGSIHYTFSTLYHALRSSSLPRRYVYCLSSFVWIEPNEMQAVSLLLRSSACKFHV
jgi:hypothetical protein